MVHHRLTLLDLSALPLADAGAAGVGQHGAADLGEDFQEAIALDGGADLLRAGGDCEGHLGLDAGCQSLLGHGGCPLHVLVRAVGAGPDQARLEIGWPLVLAQCIRKLHI